MASHSTEGNSLVELLAALKGMVDDQVFSSIERALPKDPGQIRPFAEAKGKLTTVFRSASEGRVEVIENKKSGEYVLVLTPTVFAGICEALLRPKTLADVVSDLKPISSPLPMDARRKGVDPFRLEDLSGPSPAR